MQDVDRLDYYTVYNNGREHFMIRGLCQYKRDEKWQRSRNFTEALIDVREEVKINYVGVILPSDDFEAITRTARSLESQKHRPARILMVPDKELVPDLIHWSKNNLRRWTVVNHVGETNPKDYVIQRFRPFHFFSFFNAGYTVDRDVFSTLDVAINDWYTRFSFIDGDEHGNGLTLSQPLYDSYLLTVDALAEELRKGNTWLKFEDITGLKDD